METVLTIAGSDCCGGAGIQADIKTITRHQMDAASVITAITAQNRTKITEVNILSPQLVAAQLDAVLEEKLPKAVKIGMVGNEQIIGVIAEKLHQYKIEYIVLDPVMVSTSGTRLLNERAIKDLTEQLFSMATLITPNLLECQVLLNRGIQTENEMEEAAKELFSQYQTSILMKGGHLKASKAKDLLYDGNGFIWYEREWIVSQKTHGTGCRLSSAIACNLAKKNSLSESVKNAKDYVANLL